MDKAFIFYCSPAGTTRHVAEVIEKTLHSFKRPVTVCELGKNREKLNDTLREITESKQRICLFIGSPVYSSHALPLVMDQIKALPAKLEAYAVPFVTWGAATSGIALAEMGSALTQHGCKLAGAARIVAVHSLMWEVGNPAGKGHPDREDDDLIKKLTTAVENNLQKPDPKLLPEQVLSYQSAAVTAEMKQQNLELARKFLPPRRVNQDLCNQCGVCADKCPVAALTLAPYPTYAKHCILCFNCMRWCPEHAIEADLSPAHEMVRLRYEKYKEYPLSKIFLPA
jgi:ferredoxin/flavodoxin